MRADRSVFSDIHREIIKFFQENPTCIDTAKGISVWINQDMIKVRKALTDLVRHNILIAHKVTSTTGYSYTQDKKIIRLLKGVLDPSKKKRRER